MVKRIVAIIGIILLLALYVITFIAALTDDPATMNYLGASIGGTVLIPVMIWAGMMLFGKKKDEE